MNFICNRFSNFNKYNLLEYIHSCFKHLKFLNINPTCKTTNLKQKFINISISLQSFYVTGNQIKKFDGFYAEATSLKELNLSENKINEITVGAFEKLPALEILNLEGNQLTSIYTGTFDSLFKLHVLDLSFNPIKQLHQQIFKNNPKLDIKLQNTQITNIDFIQEGQLITVGFEYFEKNLKKNQEQQKNYYDNQTSNSQLLQSYKEMYSNLRTILISNLIAVIICFAFVGLVIYLYKVPTVNYCQESYENIDNLETIELWPQDQEEVYYDQVPFENFPGKNMKNVEEIYAEIDYTRVLRPTIK